MKQIELIYIVKIQRATIRLFEAQDEECPDGRVVKIYERTIQHWLNKITSDETEQRKILDIIETQNWNTEDVTFKPICNKLRELGYQILTGNNDE